MLLLLPVISSFDERKEYAHAQLWRDRFCKDLSPFLNRRVPSSVSGKEMLSQLTIPYQARWTFGEDLCVDIEARDSTNGNSLSYKHPSQLFVGNNSCLFCKRTHAIRFCFVKPRRIRP